MKIKVFIVASMMSLGVAIGTQASSCEPSVAVGASLAPAASQTTAKRTTVSNMSDGYVMTAKGFGPIKVGMLSTAIPKTLSGVYDKLVYHRNTNNKPTETCERSYPHIKGFYIGTLGTIQTVILYVDKRSKLCGAVVYSPKVKSEAGVYPGMPESQLKKVKGIQSDVDVMSGETAYWDSNHIAYWLTWEGPSKVAGMAFGDYME
ncbi:MAG TPA: hypothetical protein K8V47_02360 [Candidatus Amulumruptor caecigallinarius]|uniref:Uncharacterized protein n=1 Tax=Candidatus Amulumruptor caecigallinarius TaxID=2109911 RepID=A0A921JHJ7_9BACT|nr:hypothetical protein [Candidatus Amulumruptor caecigallinarius]